MQRDKFDMYKNTIAGDYGKSIIVYPDYPQLPKVYEDPDILGVHVFSRAHIHPFTVNNSTTGEPLVFQSVDHYLAYLTAIFGRHAHKNARKALDIALTVNNQRGYYKRLIRKMEPTFIRGEDGISGKELRQFERTSLLKDAYKAKFNAPECEALKRYLCATGDAVLVEDVPNDTYWSAGHRPSSKAFKSIDTWRGFNAAGRELMKVRDSLV